MTTLYEVRDRIIDIYRGFDYVFRPLFKFLLALAILFEISHNMGFMGRLNNYLLIMIIALACTLMPMSMMAAVLALVVLLHLYSLSMEAAALGAAILLIVFLIFFRFAPHSGVILLLMPLAMTLNLHFAVPLAAGLLFSVGACVPVALGVVIWQYLYLVVEHRNWLRGADSVERLLTNFRFLVDHMVHNRAMWVMAGTLAATVLVVYFIRRLAVAHSWLIASAAGALTEILILVYAEYHYGVPAEIVRNIPWILLSLLIAVVLTFFVFNVDFARMAHAQFADADYYYFVKAIPRVSMEAPDRKASDFYREAPERDLYAYGAEESAEEAKPAAAHTTVLPTLKRPAAAPAAPAAPAPEKAAPEKTAPAKAAPVTEKTPQQAQAAAVPEETAAEAPAPAAEAPAADMTAAEAPAAETSAAGASADSAASPSFLDKVRKFLDDWSRTGAGARTDEPEAAASAEAEESGEGTEETETEEEIASAEAAVTAAEEDSDDLFLPETAVDGQSAVETDEFSRELAEELSRELSADGPLDRNT